MAKTNKTINQVALIDTAILTLGSIMTDDDHDRARLAWWINETFLRGDYRENLHALEKKMQSPILGIDFAKGKDLSVAMAIKNNKPKKQNADIEK